MRRKIVAGNWKMNLNLEEGLNLARSVDRFMQKSKKKDVDVIMCTPYIHLSKASDLLGSPAVSIGAQDCSDKSSGAYTGEISAEMISSTGATYVIIGHSERRSYHKEDNELLNNKVKAALDKRLKVIFCCGEVLEEREKNLHRDVVSKQLREGLAGINTGDIENIIIAYEPVWAIGTGVTASKEQAQEMHAYIRSVLDEMYGKETAENTAILYGGSCKPSNSVELFSMNDVDGGLIGGASLKEDDFCSIIDTFPG
ncbi:MAG TPA: triose-phosphate isomerase [Bacteroidales bacterium]|nr:triose-phosphate isomerase [Bacteroidales bacterium]